MNKLLLILFCLPLLFSCNKQPEVKIIGKWSSIDSNYEFSDNGKVQIYSDSQISERNYKLHNDVLIMSFNNRYSKNISYRYEFISKNKLKLVQLITNSEGFSIDGGTKTLIKIID